MKRFLKQSLYPLLVLALALTLALGVSAKADAAKISKAKATIAASQKLTLKVTGAKQKPKWSTSDKSVAAVSSKGVVTAKSEGTAKITAKIGKKKYTSTITVKGDWRAVYNSYLSSHLQERSYYVLDINKDGLPELITIKDFGAICTYYVYTLKNGAIVCAGDCSTKAGISVKYSPSKKALYCGGWTNYVGGTWENLYALKGTKLKHICHQHVYRNPKAEYYIGTTDKNAKKTSKAKHAAFCKKNFAKLKTYTPLSNTSANRLASFG